MAKVIRETLGITLSIVFVIALAGAAAAQTTMTIPFTLNGSGSLLNSPATFEGMIDSGPLSPGWFTIEVDDTGWPLDDPGTPENERWEHILTFFTYNANPGGEHWNGYFPVEGGILPPVTWRFYKGGDQLGGIIRYLVITIQDSDADGEVDQDELANQTVAANFNCHIEQSSGVYLGFCGTGPSNGNLENFDPGMDDILTISAGNLYLRDFGCSVPTENITWGAFKTMYQ